MEVIFDNKANILNAKLRATHDNSIIYSLQTTFGFLGRQITLLQDANPSPGAHVTVGAIHWKEKLFEVHGTKKKISEVKEKKGGYLNKRRYWRWAPERKEYELKHNDDEWQAILQVKDNTKIAARFSVPYRPHLFTKTDPPALRMTRTALAEDEILLILAFIYSEAKRQDNTNCSVANGSEVW